MKPLIVINLIFIFGIIYHKHQDNVVDEIYLKSLNTRDTIIDLQKQELEIYRNNYILKPKK